MSFEYEEIENNEEVFEDNNTKISDLLTPLKEVDESSYDNENLDYDNEELENEELKNKNETKEDKKRFNKLSKLGAKGIVTGLDIGNANLCRKIGHSETAEEYRADSEAIDDLIDVVEELIPKKDGKNLSIPLWLQLIIFILIAFLPTIFAAFSDRSSNKELKEEKKKKKKLKQKNKQLKQEIERRKLENELKETINEPITEEEKMQVLTGADTNENID